jgi:hypothetical protein
MAIPKVFISSTCFDLSEVREQLRKFVNSFGFDTILSEHGDIFYHPDLHTHEACVHEVTNCQLFILIIGGRFGGGYILDKEKSITNAEYEAAKNAGIPIFTYIKNNVLGNHHIYQENKNHSFVSSIKYPAIEKQEHAENIFKFVDEVRKSPTNNGFEGFDNFNEIESHLRKQWAGMFFDFLKTREVKNQIDATNHLLSGLRSSHLKLEDLIKSLYRSSVSDLTSVEQSISDVELISNVRKFYTDIFENSFMIEESYLPDGVSVDDISSVSPENLTWDEYLESTGLFERNDDLLFFHTDSYCYSLCDNSPIDLQKHYINGILKSNKAQRKSILNEIINKI